MECLLTVNDTDLCSNCDLQCCGIECQNGPNHKPEYQIFSKPLQTGCFKVKFNGPIFEVHNNYLLFLNNCNSCCKLKAIVIWSVGNDSPESSYKSCLLGHFSAMKLNNSKNWMNFSRLTTARNMFTGVAEHHKNNRFQKWQELFVPKMLLQSI